MLMCDLLINLSQSQLTCPWRACCTTCAGCSSRLVSPSTCSSRTEPCVVDPTCGTSTTFSTTCRGREEIPQGATGYPKGRARVYIIKTMGTSDDALRRHIPWRRIAPWRRITPWRRILTTHALTTHCPLTTHCGDAFPDDAFPPDDALWRHIPWQRISPWRRITPWRRIVTTHSLTMHCPLTTHYPLTTHSDDTCPDDAFPPDDALWRHIPWRRIAPWQRIIYTLTTNCVLPDDTCLLTG